MDFESYGIRNVDEHDRHCDFCEDKVAAKNDRAFRRMGGIQRITLRLVRLRNVHDALGRLFRVSPFARDIIHVSSSTSLTLLLVLNGIGVPGRLVPALLADRYFGALNLLIPTIFLAAILLYSWAAVSTLGD